MPNCSIMGLDNKSYPNNRLILKIIKGCDDKGKFAPFTKNNGGVFLPNINIQILYHLAEIGAIDPENFSRGTDIILGFI